MNRNFLIAVSLGLAWLALETMEKSWQDADQARTMECNEIPYKVGSRANCLILEAKKGGGGHKKGPGKKG